MVESTRASYFHGGTGNKHGMGTSWGGGDLDKKTSVALITFLHIEAAIPPRDWCKLAY